MSPIPPATGEKQGGQDTATTHTAGKELPGRTGRGSEGGGNSGLRMHPGWRGSTFQNGLRAGGRVSFCEKRRQTAAGLLGTKGAHPSVPRVPILPSAHLQVSPLGQFWPQDAGGGGRGLVHARLWTNSQATFSTTEARKPPQSQCSGHHSPRHS